MQTTTERSCEDCTAPLLEGAQFCVACGASVAAPSTCPKCAASLPAAAKFCPSCGGKVVGARPKVEAAVPAPNAEAPAAAPAVEAAPAPPPPRPKTGSSIGSNVLLFVAFLLVLVVVIYEMNKDAEKSVSPFAGGPAPNMGGAPPPPPAGGAPVEAAGGEPIKGSVKIAASLGAPPSGTMFVILRNQGMPNKGPPLAVKRVESPSFPASFTLGPDDIMMKGLPFTGPFDIYVRLDADGDPMTKAPGDLTNEKPKSGVLAGAKDVEIELDQRL